MPKNPKRPKDTNQKAKLIVDLLTGEKTEEKPEYSANKAKGGKKGGKAQAAKLDSSKRKEIAQKAAKKRWSKE